MATPLLNPFVGGGQDSVGSGSSGTPVGAVTANNPQKGVKRSILGNPVGVPQQLPGFRGRVVDAGGPVKTPKLRNGNLNNTTSNVRVPYNRVAPLEFLSSYTGRLSPGDVVFVHKYAPGFINSRPQATNATLGVNTMTRVVGLDGINRLLMGSNPDGWRLDANVMWLNDPRPPKDKDGKNLVDADGNALPPQTLSPIDVTSGGNTAEFKLSVLDEYRLDGLIISNDEPGTFTSSGARDNVVLNVAIQGPTECNNGFLKYDDAVNTKKGSDLYNPLTGVTNERTVESYARGSSESGSHLEAGHRIPGRVGSPWLDGTTKTDFVANFCGTYSTYPSQMFDRRVEPMNGLYLGLRAYELSTRAKMQVRDAKGELVVPTMEEAELACMVFFQYMPFSSRVAAVIGQVTDAHAKATGLNKEQLDADPAGRAAAAKQVGATKRRSSLSDYNTPFDQCTYDPVRTDDLRHMVGAWHVGRVLDTKAARHDPYAGGPRDTAFSCIVDVGLSWRSAAKATVGRDADVPSLKQRDAYGATPSEKRDQQKSVELTNAAQPALGGDNGVLGPEFGSKVLKGTPCDPNYTQKREALDKAVRRKKEIEATKAEAARRRVQAAKDKKLAATEANKKVLADKEAEYGIGDKSPQRPLDPLRAELLDLARAIDPNAQVSQEELDRQAATVQAYKDFIESNDADTVREALRVALAAAVEAEIQGTKAYTTAIDTNTGILDAVGQKVNNAKASVAKANAEYDTLSADSPMRSVLGSIRAKLETRVSMTSKVYRTIYNRLMQKKKQREARAAAAEKQATVTSAPWEEELEEHMHVLELVAISASGHAHLGCCLLPLPQNPAAASKAPTPTGAAAKPRGRSKTPPKSRTAPGTRAPAAAAGMSSTPLVPTSASPIVDAVTAAATAAANAVTSTLAPVTATPAAATASTAAPRRRAREGGESSTTNSVFESMFATSPTAAAMEEPASPTPSSGSEGQAPGPRTFRRIQR